MATVAVCEPVPAGANATLMLQLAPAASVPTQSSFSVKAGAEIEMPVIGNGVAPLLLSVMVCAPEAVPTTWLPKLSAGAESTSPGLAPAPDSATICVPMLSVIGRLAVSAPFIEGWKVTPIVQLEPDGRAAPQEFEPAFEMTKSPTCAGMARLVSAAGPVLLMVSSCE